MLEQFTWFKQSAYLWKNEGLNVYIDPWGITTGDKADVILVTHAHSDHFQPGEIEKIRQPKTKILAPRDVANELKGDVTAVKPGDNIKVGSLSIQAVPAYNVKPERAENHPKSKQWVGYVLTLGGRSIYHAGDTDHAPELNQVKADITFLPIGGHDFTMDVSEAAGLAKTIKPQLAVPMHYGFFVLDDGSVVGTPPDAERFVREASPIKVEILQPQNAFPKEAMRAR